MNMTNHDVVKKLLGKISPVGESHTDEQRFENLKETCKLTESLFFDITDMAVANAGKQESSIKKCVDYAVSFVKRITEQKWLLEDKPPMSKEDFIKKYHAAYPDVHGRTRWQTWEDIDQEMSKDLDLIIAHAKSEKVVK